MTELPPGYSFQPKPAFQSGDDCMGYPYQQWVQVALTPHLTNKLIMATGGSEAEVTTKLTVLCWEDHNFRNLPDQERLEQLVEMAIKQGRFYDTQLVDAITILARRK